MISHKQDKRLLKCNRFKLMLDVKNFIRKMYLRNNLNFESIRFKVFPDYKKKRLLIQFKRLKWQNKIIKHN